MVQCGFQMAQTGGQTMRRIMSAAILAGAVAALGLSAMPAAKAEVQYPWCAYYTGADGDGGTNCGFTTLAQCRAAISGAGGICDRNPMYPEPRPERRRR
jgi:hypothetical protein